MGTFHHDKHELHGITVIVETSGPELYIGRCDDIVAQGVILRDADVHREGREGDPASSAVSRADFLDHARRFGAWPNLKHILVPAESVREIRRLGGI
ncbi:MAG: hypothetical protein ABI689_08745 [Thermoanaerobaculia bacterium]